MSYPCPCCGHRTLPEPPPGTYYICPVCFWEDDPVQHDHPDLPGGANRVSLREAQCNFEVRGASELRFKAYVKPPVAEEARDAGWRPLSS